MLNYIIVIFCDLLLIAGAVAFYKKTANSIRRNYRSLIESDNRELTKLIEEFIRFFDRFEMYFDKEMSSTEFLTELKSKGIIDEQEQLNIPIGTDEFKMPVYDTLSLRYVLRCAGELIYEKADLMKKWHNTRIEQLDVYEEFSKKFQELILICSKHSRREKEIEILIMES